LSLIGANQKMAKEMNNSNKNQDQDIEKEDKQEPTKADFSIVDFLWNLLASTRFAVVLLSFIAVTALIGAFLPQQPSPQDIERLTASWGESAFNLFNALGLFDLYHTRWFTGSLALLCINLLVCSLNRLPIVLRLVKKRDTVLASGDPETLRIHHGFDYSGDMNKVIESVKNRLGKHRWHAAEEVRGENRFFFINRGAYSRLGVFVVHLSVILVILGSLIGVLFGFHGRLIIGEGETTDIFFRGGKSFTETPMGFEVHCNKFSFTTDPETGMEGNYESDLTILDGNREINRVKLRVNHPYSYRGLSFYQASYEAAGIGSADVVVFSSDGRRLGKATVPGDGSPADLPGGGKMRLVRIDSKGESLQESELVAELDSGDAGKYLIRMVPGKKAIPAESSYKVEIVAHNAQDGSEITKFAIQVGEQKEIAPGTKVKLLNYYPAFPVHGKEAPAAKIEVTTDEETREHMLFDSFPNFDKLNLQGKIYYSIGEVEEIARETQYSGPSYQLLGLNESYRTIIDVNRDPGVPVVWTGCSLLLAGLYLAFFLSHRKMWIKVSPGRVSAGGTVNRNTQAFEIQFRKVVSQLEHLISGKPQGGSS